jgi:hypothetical protein
LLAAAKPTFASGSKGSIRTIEDLSLQAWHRPFQIGELLARK